MSTGCNKMYGAQVIKKYGNKCWYCGIKLTNKTRSMDHLKPRKYGGLTNIENLRPSCRSCNASKGCGSLERLRLLAKMKKAELPKCLTATVLVYLEQEYGFVIEMPEHEFYFETKEQGITNELELEEYKPPKNNTFKKPSYEQLIEYVNEQKLSVNARQFIDYYESNGWQVGRTKMKDWQAAVRNWARRQKTYSKEKSMSAPDKVKAAIDKRDKGNLIDIN